MSEKTEFEKNMEYLKREIPFLNSKRFFSCERLSARMSYEQCVKNFKKAEIFVESEYLKNADKKPYWGFYGKAGFVHPLINECKGCPVGEANLSRKAKK